MENRFKILKARYSDKWLELWLEGKPFSKVTVWNDQTEKAEETDEDQWNDACKIYMFFDCFRKSLPEVDIHQAISNYGLTALEGYFVEFDSVGHPATVYAKEAPVTEKTLAALFSDLQIEGLTREADEVIAGLKDTGLMAPEICFIAFKVISKMKGTAAQQVQTFYKDLPATLKRAEDLLKELKENENGPH